MLTRCPHCQTIFRVGPEQLKVRQGKVRCGRCLTVFDGLDALADELPAVVSPDVPPRDEAVPTTEPPVQEEGVLPVPDNLHEANAPEEIALPTGWTQTEPDAGAEPRRWPWSLGVLTLLMLAAGQLLFIFRVELAVQWPEARPTLAAFCALLDCSVPYPRKVELVGIETSDLVPDVKDRLLLSATLKNRAPYRQEYPHLELTLTDTHDESVLRKVLAPAEYLSSGALPGSGFAARDEVAIKLLLDVKDIPAVGYRLYLFYP